MFSGYFLMTWRNPIIYTGHIHVRCVSYLIWDPIAFADFAGNDSYHHENLLPLQISFTMEMFLILVGFRRGAKDPTYTNNQLYS
jgi:hypothetical protein